MIVASPGSKHFLICLAGVLALALPAVFAQDSPPAAGVLWEITSQLTMEGMSFGPPAQTRKVCAPAAWIEPPGADNDERGSVNSGFERLDNTVTWTSSCTGPPQMAGRGDIVFEDETAQAYTGKINYASDEGSVVIVLGGRVLGAWDQPQ